MQQKRAESSGETDASAPSQRTIWRPPIYQSRIGEHHEFRGSGIQWRSSDIWPITWQDIYRLLIIIEIWADVTWNEHIVGYENSAVSDVYRNSLAEDKRAVQGSHWINYSMMIRNKLWGWREERTAKHLLPPTYIRNWPSDYVIFLKDTIPRLIDIFPQSIPRRKVKSDLIIEEITSDCP